jgi:hypothetical protein
MSDIDDNLVEIEDEMEHPFIIIDETPVIIIDENPVIEENIHECDKNVNSLEKVEKKSPPVRPPSVVWQHYEKIFDEGIHIHTKCNYCNQKYSTKYSTTTLNDHFKKNHKKIQPQKEGSIEAAFANSQLSTYNLRGQEHLDLSNKLINWIIVECLPFRTVESSSFCEFIKALNPNFQVLSRRTLRSKIIDKYIKYKNNIIKMFQVKICFLLLLLFLKYNYFNYYNYLFRKINLRLLLHLICGHQILVHLIWFLQHIGQTMNGILNMQ